MSLENQELSNTPNCATKSLWLVWDYVPGFILCHIQTTNFIWNSYQTLKIINQKCKTIKYVIIFLYLIDRHFLKTRRSCHQLKGDISRFMSIPTQQPPNIFSSMSFLWLVELLLLDTNAKLFLHCCLDVAWTERRRTSLDNI